MNGQDHPHSVEAELERVNEYQSPPREESEESKEGSVDPEDDSRVDINVLESQQRPGLQTSETIDTAPSNRTYTISTQDEEADPGNPRAVPPGESM